MEARRQAALQKKVEEESKKKEEVERKRKLEEERRKKEKADTTLNRSVKLPKAQARSSLLNLNDCSSCPGASSREETARD